jgi:16S rRNA processing protein RimM
VKEGACRLEWIKIGKIINTRGLKGEVKVISYTDYKDERYLSEPIFLVQNGHNTPLTVEYYRQMPSHDLLKFKGYDDINQVEMFKGLELYAHDRKIAIKDPSVFHARDLIGLHVRKNAQIIGHVIDIRTFPQGDYLVISQEEGRQSLVPFRDEFIEKLDIEAGWVDIVMMEGLL